MNQKKKRTKKYSPHKITDDYIHCYEHSVGVFGQFFNKYCTSIKNMTLNDLINDGIMVYRFSFLYEKFNPEESAQEVRDIFDKYFLLHEYTDNLNTKILLEEEEEELLLYFLDIIKNKLFSIRSREEYAKYMQNMFVDCNIYIGLKAKWIKKWVDVENVADALKMCRRRIELPNIIKNNRAGKFAYHAEDGSIQYEE